MSRLQQNRIRNSWLWAALLVSLLVALWVQLPRILDPYRVEEDFRNLSWMHRFQEPHLFEGDPLIYNRVLELDIGSLHILIDSGSPGYSLLFQVASYLMPVILFGKLLFFPLLLASVYFVFRIGENIRGPGTGLGLALAFILLNIASINMFSTAGGLPRSFAQPLILGTVWFLMCRRYRMAALTVLLSGLIYPPAFLLSTVIYGLSLIHIRRDGLPFIKIDWRPALYLVMAIILATVALLPVLMPQIGTVQQSFSMSQAPTIQIDSSRQAGGRYELFTVFPIVGRGGISTVGVDILHIFFLTLLAILIWLWRKDTLTEFPETLKLLFFAGWMCFLLAWTGFWITGSFLFYLPSRYTQMALPLFLFIFVGVNVEQAMHSWASWLMGQSGKLYLLTATLALVLIGLFVILPDEGDAVAVGRGSSRWLLPASAGVLLLLTFLVIRRRNRYPALLLNSGAREPSRKTWLVLGLVLLPFAVLYLLILSRVYYVATPFERDLFTFLQIQKEDVLVGGAPCLLDGVPLFARRRVLSSCESPNTSLVVLDSLMAYYSDSAAEVVDFCHEHGVDFLIVDTGDFEQDKMAEGNFFFEPYNSILASELKERSQFALNDVPADLKILERDGRYLVSCDDRLREGADIDFLD